MSSLVDIYFEEEGNTTYEIHQDAGFWSFLQTGLVNLDSLVRKRSLYLLKNVVDFYKRQNESDEVYFTLESLAFWWNPYHAREISTPWQEYVFLLEILEEKQVHTLLVFSDGLLLQKS